MSSIVGWDIGGAHVKVVQLDATGVVINVLQLPCELWRGLDKLEATILNVLSVFKVHINEAQHAVTMTGELVDLFENRQQGVQAIANLASSLFGNQVYFYAAQVGFVPIASVTEHAAAIASTNWHASTSLIASQLPEALLVDIGSTTTDIIPIINSKVANIGLTDAARMREDTLVYTGVVRTPLMALAQKLNFEGAETNIAAEYFATMADVYRLTEELSPAADMTLTADGQSKTALASARRLARMIGRDVAESNLQTWQTFALTCKATQMAQIKKAMLKHVKTGVPIVGAGAGAFLVKQLANELNCDYLTLSQALKIEGDDQLSMCFPAYAVAKLAMTGLQLQSLT